MTTSDEFGVYLEGGCGPSDGPALSRHAFPADGGLWTGDRPKMARWAYCEATGREVFDVGCDGSLTPGVYEFGDDAVYDLSVQGARIEFERLERGEEID